MRKIYFIIFGVALVILILLVDWRKKFDAIIGKKSQTEALLEPAASAVTGPQPNSEDSSLADALDEELNETLAASAEPEPDWQQNPLLPHSLPTAQQPPAPLPGNSLARPNTGRGFTSPRPGLRPSSQTSPRFQDVPEQPYLDESRQLLRQMMRNYDRIISANPNAGKPPKAP